MRRSLHFVPGGNERMIAKALSSPADGLILDLEDAVTPDKKWRTYYLHKRVQLTGEYLLTIHHEKASLPEGLEAGFILAVGTIEPRKNYPRLLAAHRGNRL